MASTIHLHHHRVLLSLFRMPRFQLVSSFSMQNFTNLSWLAEHLTSQCGRTGAVEKLILLTSTQSKSKQDVEPHSNPDCGSDWSPTLSHSLRGNPRYHGSPANGGNTIYDGDRDHYTSISVSQALLSKGRAERSALTVNKEYRMAMKRWFDPTICTSVFVPASFKGPAAFSDELCECFIPVFKAFPEFIPSLAASVFDRFAMDPCDISF